MKNLSTIQDLSYRETSEQDLGRDLRENRLFPDLLHEQQEHIQDKQDHNHSRDKNILLDREMVRVKFHLRDV